MTMVGGWHRVEPLAPTRHSSVAQATRKKYFARDTPRLTHWLSLRNTIRLGPVARQRRNSYTLETG